MRLVVAFVVVVVAVAVASCGFFCCHWCCRGGFCCRGFGVGWCRCCPCSVSSVARLRVCPCGVVRGCKRAPSFQGWVVALVVLAPASWFPVCSKLVVAAVFVPSSLLWLCVPYRSLAPRDLDHCGLLLAAASFKSHCSLCWNRLTELASTVLWLSELYTRTCPSKERLSSSVWLPCK